jgi:hypothetical protein
MLFVEPVKPVNEIFKKKIRTIVSLFHNFNNYKLGDLLIVTYYKRANFISSFFMPIIQEIFRLIYFDSKRYYHQLTIKLLQ